MREEKNMNEEKRKNIFHFINFSELEKRGVKLSDLDRKILFAMNDNEHLFITRTALRIALKEKENFIKKLYESIDINLNFETFTHLLITAHKEDEEEIIAML